MQSILKDKNILIISPNFWGDVRLSKHHYALELAKLGAKVYFLNPPSREIKTMLITTSGNITVIDFKIYIPGRLKKIFPKFFYMYMNSIVKKISQILRDDIYMTLDFSNDLTFSENKENYFKAKYNIFFPVDNPSKNYCKKSKNISDYYFSVSNQILNLIEKGDVNYYIIGHSLSNQFLGKKYIPTKYSYSNSNYNFCYVGNFLMNNIDYYSLLKIVKFNEHVNFHFVGPHDTADRNNNLGVQKLNTNYVNELKSMKNTIFHGIKTGEELKSLCRPFDGMLVCYFEIGKNPNACFNSHKILEYLSMGKVVISNYFEDYKDLNGKYIFMPNKNHSSEDYLNNFNETLNNIKYHNKEECQTKRAKYVRNKSYRKAISLILNLVIN